MQLRIAHSGKANFIAITAIEVVAIVCILLWREPILGLLYLAFSNVPSLKSTFLGDAGFVIQVALTLVVAFLAISLASVLLAEGLVRLLRFGGRLILHHG